MADPQWFVRKGEKTHGPFSSSKLKQLAQGSKISPDTDVRRGDGKWGAARRVNGLFNTTEPASQPITTPDPQPPAVIEAQLAPAHPAPTDIISAQTTVRIPCPICGEEIAATAVKCRHCNEFLDGRQQHAAQTPQMIVAPSAVANTTVVVQQQGPQKSVFVALLLTFFFGPFGMFYSTAIGGLVMLGVWFVVILLCFVWIGFLLIPVAIIAELVWAALACNRR